MSKSTNIDVSLFETQDPGFDSNAWGGDTLDGQPGTPFYIGIEGNTNGSLFIPPGTQSVEIPARPWDYETWPIGSVPIAPPSPTPIQPPPEDPEDNELDSKPISPLPAITGLNNQPRTSAFKEDYEHRGAPEQYKFGDLLPSLSGQENKLLSVFIENTVDRWVTPPDYEALAGYIGEEKGTSIDPLTGERIEHYIQENTEFRNDNQIQPAAFIKVDGVNDTMSWQELLAQMSILGLDTDEKTDCIFSTTKYSYQPPVDPDHFVNYSRYIWVKMLTGTASVEVGSRLVTASGVSVASELGVGESVRIAGHDFIVESISGDTFIIDLQFDNETDAVDVGVGISNPLYYVQQVGDFDVNGWTDNNYWVHEGDISSWAVDNSLDPLWVKGLIGGGTLPRGSVPIIELEKDIMVEDFFTPGKAPSVTLWPLEYVDPSNRAIPTNAGYEEGDGVFDQLGWDENYTLHYSIQEISASAISGNTLNIVSIVRIIGDVTSEFPIGTQFQVSGNSKIGNDGTYTVGIDGATFISPMTNVHTTTTRLAVDDISSTSTATFDIGAVLSTDALGFGFSEELIAGIRRDGLVPITAAPALEYAIGDTNLDGSPTEIDPHLGIRAIKETAEGSEYIFINGLVDSTYDDIRAGRLLVYAVHVDEGDYDYRAAWRITLDPEVAPSRNSEGEWNIAENFGNNIQKTNPKTLSNSDLTDHLRSIISGNTAADSLADGREYRLHPDRNLGRGGTIFQYEHNLDWWLSLMLQNDSSPDTVLNFAREEHIRRQHSIRGLIERLANDLSDKGAVVTQSQFRILLLEEIRNLQEGVLPNPFKESTNGLPNFIATPAHFGLVKAVEPGFVYDHISQKLAYKGMMGEIISLPFSDSKPNRYDLLYHDIQMIIYLSVPLKFREDYLISETERRGDFDLYSLYTFDGDGIEGVFRLGLSIEDPTSLTVVIDPDFYGYTQTRIKISNISGNTYAIEVNNKELSVVGSVGVYDTVDSIVASVKFDIIGVNQPSQQFLITGDQTSLMTSGTIIEVIESTGNNRRYTIDSSFLDGLDTRIQFVSGITSVVVDGVINLFPDIIFTSYFEDVVIETANPGIPYTLSISSLSTVPGSLIIQDEPQPFGGTPMVYGDDYILLSNLRDIAFSRYMVPPSGTDNIAVIVGSYSYTFDAERPPEINKERTELAFNILNYVYPRIEDKTPIVCYSEDDILKEENNRFNSWLKRRKGPYDIAYSEPYKNIQDEDNAFSWNYKDEDGAIPAVWHEIYLGFFNSSGPQYEPWIIQGYELKPGWWDLDYPPNEIGLYPYRIMWEGIQNGEISEGRLGSGALDGGVVAPVLQLPINFDTGELLAPYSSDPANPSVFGEIPEGRFNDYIFSDNYTAEQNWRCSLDFVWDSLDIGYNLKPIDFISYAWDADALVFWKDGYSYYENIGVKTPHYSMVFYGEEEEVVKTGLATTIYTYMGDGSDLSFSGTSYELGPIEEFEGNGLQTNFVLNTPWGGATYDSVVEVDAIILSEGTINASSGAVEGGEYGFPDPLTIRFDISPADSVSVRVRLASPRNPLVFDPNDDIGIIVEGVSRPESSFIENLPGQEISFNFAIPAFNRVDVMVFNPLSIQEQGTEFVTKNVNGINQWYSQFYHSRGRSVDVGTEYDSYWKQWNPRAIYRSDHILNPDSVIIQTLGQVALTESVDYELEVDRTRGSREFYVDSLVIRVIEKTETSFDNDGKSPTSTIFEVDNFDPRRNFVHTAVRRKDAIYLYTILPPVGDDEVIIYGFDNNGDELRFTRYDGISLVIDNEFYDIEVNTREQSIGLSAAAIAALDPSGSEVHILIEPKVRLVPSQSSTVDEINNVLITSDIETNSKEKGTVESTVYEWATEYEVDEYGDLKTQDVILPRRFEGAEGIFEFLCEYERYLLEEGAVFDHVLEESGEFNDWVLGRKEFIRYVDRLELYLIDPKTRPDRMEINTSGLEGKIGTVVGLVAPLESQADFYSKRTQSLLDINGFLITPKETQVLRRDSVSAVQVIPGSQTIIYFADGIPFTPKYVLNANPIERGIIPLEGEIWFDTRSRLFFYYLSTTNEFVISEEATPIRYVYEVKPLSIYTIHWTIDNYEHIIRFENLSSTGREIYEPLTGNITERLYAQFERNRSHFGRPSLGGFVIDRQDNDNLGMFSNIESQIQGQLELYDPFNVPLIDKFSNAIPELLGIENDNYLSKLLGTAGKRSQIGFHQGFIKEKGARDNIDAYLKAIKSIDEMTLHEVWAYKVAEYGDSSGDDYVTIKVSEKEGARTILGLHFTDISGSEEVDAALIEVTENDPNRFTDLLDRETTKDGYRFYFPSIDEGSKLPSWGEDHIQVIKVINNPLSTGYIQGISSDYTDTHDAEKAFDVDEPSIELVADETYFLTASAVDTSSYIGIDFGTFGPGGKFVDTRVSGLTIKQQPTTILQPDAVPVSEVRIEYAIDADEVLGILEPNWISFSDPIKLEKTDGSPEKIRLPFHSVKARWWRILPTSSTSNKWGVIQLQAHLYNHLPDYEKVGKVGAYNQKSGFKTASWYPWDPAEGIHPPSVHRYVDHELERDPAIYTHAVSGREDLVRSWGQEHVGEVWWDTSFWGTIDYKDATQFRTASQRASIWGRLEAGKRVIVYEWVRSSVPPEEWSDLVQLSVDSEASPGERIPSGLARNTEDFTMDITSNPDGSQKIYYYFWVSNSTKPGFTNQGELREFNLKQIASGLEDPNSITENKYYVLDGWLPSGLATSENGWDTNPRGWDVGGFDLTSATIPSRFTKWFGNRGDLVFINDLIELQFERKFLLSGNPKPKDLLGIKYEEWTLIHRGQQGLPPTTLWDSIVHTAISPTCDIFDPNACFMDRETLIRMLNKLVIEIKPDFFPEGYEALTLNEEPSYEEATPFDGPESLEVFDLSSRDPLRRIRDLGDVNVIYFDPDKPDVIEALLARDSLLSFWNLASTAQVNELFFDLLEASLAVDYREEDIFKTSWVGYTVEKRLIQETEWTGGLSDLNLAIEFLSNAAKPYHTKLNHEISKVTFALADRIQVKIEDEPFESSTVEVNLYDSMGVGVSDDDNAVIGVGEFDVLVVSIEEEIPTTTIGFNPADIVSVGFEDEISEIGIEVSSDPINIAMEDKLITFVSSSALGYMNSEESIGVNISDSVEANINNLSFLESLNVTIEDQLDPAVGMVDSFGAAMTDEIHSEIFYTYNFPVESVGVNFTEEVRFDIVQTETVENYGMYMIHDEEIFTGEAEAPIPSAIPFIVGGTPGENADPVGEIWYRWDDLALADQPGVGGYNWDGVGNNTELSTEPGAVFIRANPLP